MSEIPEDIMAAAISCADGVTFGGYEQNALSIAKAIMSERERCVKECQYISECSREEAKLKADERQYQSANHWNAHADGCDECISVISEPPKPSSEPTP